MKSRHFGVVPVSRGIEVRRPFPALQARANEAHALVEQIPVVPRLGQQQFVVVHSAQVAGHLRHRPGIVAVLQRARGRFRHFVAGNVAQLPEVAQAAEIVFQRPLSHGAVRPREVDALKALHGRFRNHRSRVIPGHGAGLHTLQRPHRHSRGTLFGHANQAVHQVRHAPGLRQGEQRMRGAIGIPKRKRAVVVRPRGQLVYLPVHAAILAVHVVEQRGRFQCVEHRRVEDLALLLVAAFDQDLRKLALPRRVGRLPHRREVPARNLAIQVLHGAIDADSGDPHLHVDDLTRPGRIVDQGLQRGAGGFFHAGIQDLVLGHKLRGLERLGELHGEENPPAAGPPVDRPPADNRGRYPRCATRRRARATAWPYP